MFAHILVVMIVAIAITALAERQQMQPALLVAIVGLLASFIPGVPRLELEPEIILGIVLPPMLFSAASDFSFTSFARRLGSIVNLGVFMVFAVAAVVAVVATLAVPGLTLPAALVLGAVVAPPDAVTAITIGRKSGLPIGLMTVLKGESLINDAAALTLFAVAVAATAGTHAFIDSTVLYFIYAAVVGAILGTLIGNLAQVARRRLTNPSLATVISVIVPFAAYLIAEELHASGVLAVVAAGFALGHHAAESGYEERLQERQFWRTIDTLLETFVFAYIGLQLRFVITDAAEAGYDLWSLGGAAAAVFVAIVLVRFVWVFATAAFGRWRYDRILKHPRNTKLRKNRPQMPPPLRWRENLVLSWTGMRGVVTLAAAAGVPVVTATGADFPGREAIVAIAFMVTIATLLIQGLTLPVLIAYLKLTDPRGDRFAAEQQALATNIAEAATSRALASYRANHESPASQRLVEIMAKRSLRNTQDAGVAEPIDRSEALALRNVLLGARRKSLIAARDSHQLDDATLREMLEQMDLEEAFMAGMGKRTGEL